MQQVSQPTQDGTVDDVGEEIEEVGDAAQASVADMLATARDWAENALDQLLSLSSLWQVLAILGAVVLGYLLSRRPKAALLRRRERRIADTAPTDIVAKVLHALAGVAWPLAVVILLWIANAVFEGTGQPNTLLKIAASLTNAAILVRLLTGNMRVGPLRTLIALTLWTIAALYIVGWLEPVQRALDGPSVAFGGTDISLLDVVKSLLVAVIALWVGRALGDAAQTQLRGSKTLTPSMSGLLGQVAKIGLMILALYIALTAVGFNMGAFAVLGGAIGIGIGFGLQSIFQNFISGIIILLEKSVQVGDFIELQSGVRGQVREINIRSTLVTTNDSVDILVPNAEFISAQVINWTLRDPRRRLRIPFGVAYGTDKEVVRRAGLEAAAAVPWTDTDAALAPSVWLVQFGDSSLNYELVVWLNEEAVKKPARVEADYNWALHTALEKYDLEIPFPQRDLNIRQPAEITVRMAKD